MRRTENRQVGKFKQKDEIDEEISNYKSKKVNMFNKKDFDNLKIELTSKQHELYTKIRNSTLTIVSGPAGSSKAQPLDSPILTPNGWSTMGEIEIGDRVISVDGEPTIVTGIFPQGKIDIWELTFSDGSKVECCSDHLWFTQTDNDRNNRKYIGISNGKKIREKCQKDGSVKTTLEIVDTLYDKRNRVNHSVPIVSPVNFNEQDVIIDPYIMGCLLGDGCFRNHIGFTSADEEIVNDISEILKEDNMLLSQRSNYDYAKNKYKEYLEQLGIYGKYSDTKFIPDCYKYNSIDNRVKILQGLMDTDGSIDKKGYSISYTSTSIRLIKDVKEIVQSLGGIATERKVQHPNYIYKDELKKGKDTYSLTITMNPNINPFKLSRKSDIVIPKTKYKPTRYIVAARLIDKKEAKCITVNHPSHLYITNDYIVTHNTFTTCYTALGLLADKKIEKIIITKPIVEAGESIGFLPGSIDEKVEVYMKSYVNTFEKILGKFLSDVLFASGIIEIELLAYMRGSTYDNSIMILDEAQNVKMSQLILWATRLGKNSYAVLAGDVSQYDIDHKDAKFLTFIDLCKDMDSVSNFEFGRDDIVRNKFLIELTDRYEKWKYSTEDGKKK